MHPCHPLFIPILLLLVVGIPVAVGWFVVKRVEAGGTAAAVSEIVVILKEVAAAIFKAIKAKIQAIRKPKPKP